MSWIWGWVLTALGPLAYAARGVLPGAGLVRGLKVAAYVVVLGAGAWGGWAALRWWEGDKLTHAEAKVACGMSIAEASIAAKLKALDERATILANREVAAASDELRISELMRTLQEARDAATNPDDDVIVFRADDAWVRGARRPQGAGAPAHR